MTKRVLIQARELDRAAEKAGGYVAAPGSLRTDPKAEHEFSVIRNYSLQHKIPIPELTADDYARMGLRPPRA